MVFISFLLLFLFLFSFYIGIIFTFFVLFYFFSFYSCLFSSFWWFFWVLFSVWSISLIQFGKCRDRDWFCLMFDFDWRRSYQFKWMPNICQTHFVFIIFSKWLWLLFSVCCFSHMLFFVYFIRLLLLIMIVDFSNRLICSLIAHGFEAYF